MGETKGAENGRKEKKRKTKREGTADEKMEGDFLLPCHNPETVDIADMYVCRQGRWREW